MWRQHLDVVLTQRIIAALHATMVDGHCIKKDSYLVEDVSHIVVMAMPAQITLFTHHSLLYSPGIPGRFVLFHLLVIGMVVDAQHGLFSLSEKRCQKQQHVPIAGSPHYVRHEQRFVWNAPQEQAAMEGGEQTDENYP
eukprot:758364-Hanusia_phi.AAC.5